MHEQKAIFKRETVEGSRIHLFRTVILVTHPPDFVAGIYHNDGISGFKAQLAIFARFKLIFRIVEMWVVYGKKRKVDISRISSSLKVEYEASITYLHWRDYHSWCYVQRLQRQQRWQRLRQPLE